MPASRSKSRPQADLSCPPQIVAGVLLMAGSTAVRGPLAASMALVAWGALCLARPRFSLVARTIVVVVYVALGVLAFLAQCDAANRATSFAWRCWAVGDAAAAVSLTLSLVGRWITASR